VVLWVMTPCSDVVGYQSLGWSCCLHIHHEDEGSIAHRNVAIIPQHYGVSKHRIQRLVCQATNKHKLIKYMFNLHKHNAVQNQNLITTNKFFHTVALLKYLGITVKYPKSRLNSGDACYH